MQRKEPAKSMEKIEMVGVVVYLCNILYIGKIVRYNIFVDR